MSNDYNKLGREETRGCSWFSVRHIGDQIYAITEPGHVNSFLVIGSRRAVLFDTGLGMVNVAEVCAQLTARPIMVVNSHSHFDHRGGNGLFLEIGVHAAGVAELGRTLDSASLTGYVRRAQTMWSGFQDYHSLDEEFFHLIDQTMWLRPLPASVVNGEWVVRGSVPTVLLSDGDIVNLGDRSLVIIHSPGHSPDSVCAFDTASGALLAGDVLVAGTSFGHLRDSNPCAFAESTARLDRDFGRRVTCVLTAHALRCQMDGNFLSEVATGWASVVSGRAVGSASEDMYGVPVVRYKFERFAVTVAR